jgi:uncharacterized lipoprotein YddW (UPF0748 family)
MLNRSIAAGRFGWRLGAAVFFAAATTVLPAQEFRAFWVDAFGIGFRSSSEVTTLINEVRAANGNAVVVEVRKRGDAYYNSNYEPKASDISPPSFDPLADLIAKAHDTNAGPRIEVHAWIVSYRMWQSSDTNTAPANHPVRLHGDWLNQTDTGVLWTSSAGYQFDPGHPGVQQHTFNVCMDIVTNYNVDGLNFDYIRYDGPQWGYNPVSVARFNARYGRAGQPASSDEVWKQWRRDQVTALVRKVYLSSVAAKPGVKISADTITWAPGVTDDTGWTNSARAYTDVLQDWRSWMQEGILDLNIPMAYFDLAGAYTTSWTNWNNFAKDRRFNRHVVIGPGIYLNSISNAIVEMRHVRRPSPGGNYAEGICCYSYRTTNKDGVSRATFQNALVNPTSYDAVSPPIFAAPATVPVMPWKVAPTKGHLKGLVLNATNSAVFDGATVTISGPTNKTMLTDATGFFGAVDLAPGSYTISASFSGYGSTVSPFTVSAGEVTHVDLRLPATGQTPVITAQPQSLTVAVGANASFSVSAAGETPLAYQWRHDGTNIAGATATNLTRTNAQVSHAGDYTVTVSNAFGSVTSQVATLTVAVPPTITSQPQSQSVPLGSNATFSVVATGTAPLAYRWRSNAVTIAGQTNATLAIFGVQASYTANYTVVVTNIAGLAVSSNAVLTVLPPSPVYGVAVIPGARAALVTWNTTVPASAQVEYGSTTNYGALTAFNGGPRTNHAVLLAGLAPDATYYFRAISVAGGNTYRSDGGSFATTTSHILDNTNAAFTGSWSTGTSATDKYGPDYRFIGVVNGNPTATAAFAPNLAVAGNYDVFVWYPQGGNRTTSAAHAVVFNGGSATTNLNQEANGGGWRLLAAAKPFAAGTNGYVLIANNAPDAGQVVMADAVRFTYSAGQEPPASGSVPAWWANYYFGSNVTASADHDGDGYTTWEEFCLGTDPTNAASRLVFTLESNGPMRLDFTPWFPGRLYQLLCRSNLTSGAWVTLTNAPLSVTTNGTAAFTITNANGPRNFYRLKVDWTP